MGTARLPVHNQDPTRDRVLAAIVKHWKEKGYAPSVLDLCNAVGVSSTSTVQSHIRSLMYAGKIEVTPGVARSIRVVES